MTPRRALGTIRLSNLTDATTSPERQRQSIEAEAARRGSIIVGYAEDLDVSASKYSPRQRPELGKWLKRSGDWDELIFWRIDRFVRSVSDFDEMVRFCRDNGKGLVSATESFDLNDPLGEAMAYLAAIFARMEARAIQLRVLSSRQELRKTGRWPGGRTPWGYKVIPNPAGKGYVLDVDPDSSEQLKSIIARVMRGESCNSIALDLTAKGVLTPADYALRAAGKEIKGHAWHRGVVEKILRSRILIGEIEHVVLKDGETKRSKDTTEVRTVRGSDGLPVRYAINTILTDSEYRSLQEQLKSREVAKTQRTKDAALLLRVAFCFHCGAPMYLSQSRPRRGSDLYEYYRCSAKNFRKAECPSKLYPADKLDEAATIAFLGLVGSHEVQEQIIVPAEDSTEELHRVEESLSDLRVDRAAGLFRGDRGSQEFREMYARLEQRREQLEAMPYKPQEIYYRPTGETIRQRWEATDSIAEKRRLMYDAGFEVRAARDDDGYVMGYQADMALAGRVSQAMDGEAPERPSHDEIEAAFQAAKNPGPDDLQITAETVDEMIKKLQQS